MALHQSGRRDEAQERWRASLAVPAESYIRLRNLNNFIAAVITTGVDLDADAWRSFRVPDWPPTRTPAKADKEMIISLGRGLVKIGKNAEAVGLIDSARSFADSDLMVSRNFADILIEAGQPEKAHRLVSGIVATGPGNQSEMGLLRAATAHAAGMKDEAIRLTKAAVAAFPVHITAPAPSQQFLIGVINPAPRVVTRIMSPQLLHFFGNSPASLAWRHGQDYRFWSVFPEAPDAEARLDTLPPPQLILNNWVNAERLSTSSTLGAIASFVDRPGLPVLNHPRAAAQVTRQRNAERLAGIPGLVTPRVARFRNERARHASLVRSLSEDFGFPVILRDTFMQGGREAAKISSTAELATYLERAAQAELYAIEFIDNPVAGGLFRKIRAGIIGDDVIIAHVQFGTGWNVHRERNATRITELAIPPGEQDFASRILLRPEETLGKSAIAALHEVRDRVPLDVYGIDFDLLPDGRLVFFEANASMNVAMADRPGKGVEPIRARMREALHRLFQEVGSPTGGN
jgi:glutathione synthase/RimK-type ligase-like ATP-grasp enzyme